MNRATAEKIVDALIAANELYAMDLSPEAKAIAADLCDSIRDFLIAQFSDDKDMLIAIREDPRSTIPCYLTNHAERQADHE